MSWRFWFLWILAGVIGWMVAGVLTYPLLSFLTILVGGALVSLLHTLLLQQFMAPFGWWRYGLLFQAGSWLFPLLLLPVVAWSPAALLFSWDQLPGLTAVIIACSLLVVSMVLVGGGQGFALRPLLQYPWRWTAVPGIALLTSGLVVIGLNFTLLPLIANLVHSGTFSMALPSTGFVSPTVVDKLGLVWVFLQLLIAIVASGTYGLVTGVALVALVTDNGAENTIALA